jgi:transposase-like protein
MNIEDFAADYLVDKKEVMRNLTASLLNEVMQIEASRQIQAQPYERNGKRKAHRNGTRNRNIKTIHGEVTLKKPQFREFPFKTSVFASRRSSKNCRCRVLSPRSINKANPKNSPRTRIGEYLRIRSLTDHEKAG